MDDAIRIERDCYREALQEELTDLWTDLAISLKSSRPGHDDLGCWSNRCDWLWERISIITALVGNVPRDDVPDICWRLHRRLEWPGP